MHWKYFNTYCYEKTTYLTGLWLCIANLKAQTTVTIADTAFSHWLRITIPAVITGNQLDTTHVAVTSMKQMDAWDFDIVYLDDEMKDASPTNFCMGMASYPEKHF